MAPNVKGGKTVILEWRLANFKSIGTSSSLNLKPLTILAGANSSGKSSILHSILLICQTLDNRLTGRPLILNGEYIRLGTVDDILHAGASESEFSIGFRLAHIVDHPVLARRRRALAPSDAAQAIDTRADFTFSTASDLSGSQRALTPTLQFAKIQASAKGGEDTLGDAAEPTSTREIVLRRRTKEDLEALLNEYPSRGTFSAALEYEVDGVSIKAPRHYFTPILPGLFSRPEPLPPIGARLRHFLPASIAVPYDRTRREFDRKLAHRLERLIYRNVEREAQPPLVDASEPNTDHIDMALEHAIVDLQTALGEDLSVLEILTLVDDDRVSRDPKLERVLSDVRLRLIDVRDRINALAGELPENLGLENQQLPTVLRESVDSLTEFFVSKVRYLGPLRDEPKPVYEFSSSADTEDVGIKGQYTAAVLDSHRNDIIPYWDPQQQSIVQGPLIDAVRKWLRDFEVGYDVTTAESGKLGHTIKVRTTAQDSEFDLTNVGVGVSQVLPIIVLALVAEAGSTLLFEQPELHLHPRVQSHLADFFLGLVKCSKQAIVETHSEYLINRLRRRIAEDEPRDGQISVRDQIGLYFVEREGNESRFRDIVINEFGAIPDWPKGFFDEGAAEADRIIEAAMHKKLEKVGR